MSQGEAVEKHPPVDVIAIGDSGIPAYNNDYGNFFSARA